MPPCTVAGLDTARNCNTLSPEGKKFALSQSAPDYAGSGSGDLLRVQLPSWAASVQPGLNADPDARTLRLRLSSPADPEHHVDFRRVSRTPSGNDSTLSRHENQVSRLQNICLRSQASRHCRCGCRRLTATWNPWQLLQS